MFGNARQSTYWTPDRVQVFWRRGMSSLRCYYKSANSIKQDHSALVMWYLSYSCVTRHIRGIRVCVCNHWCNHSLVEVHTLFVCSKSPANCVRRAEMRLTKWTRKKKEERTVILSARNKVLEVCVLRHRNCRVRIVFEVVCFCQSVNIFAEQHVQGAMLWSQALLV